MKSFCIRCSAPSGRGWQVWDFIFSSCRVFFHTLGLSPSLPPFFLLSGLLCKSQLAGPWCTGGLKQEAHFCPSLPLFYGHNFPGCCARIAGHSSLTIIAIAITKSSRWHRGNTGEKQKWGQNGRGKNNSLFIAHLHHQQKSHSFLVWDSARLIKNCFCTPPPHPAELEHPKPALTITPKMQIMSMQEKQDEGFSLQDSLPIFESPPPPPRLRHLHCRESLLWTSAAAAAAAVVMKHRLVCSSSTSEPVRLSLIPTCRRKGHALADHAESNTLHLLCVGANRTQSLKKAVFFFFCLCSSNSSTQARSLSLYMCVCGPP